MSDNANLEKRLEKPLDRTLRVSTTDVAIQSPASFGLYNPVIAERITRDVSQKVKDGVEVLRRSPEQIEELKKGKTHFVDEADDDIEEVVAYLKRTPDVAKPIAEILKDSKKAIRKLRATPGKLDEDVAQLTIAARQLGLSDDSMTPVFSDGFTAVIATNGGIAKNEAYHRGNFPFRIMDQALIPQFEYDLFHNLSHDKDGKPIVTAKDENGDTFSALVTDPVLISHYLKTLARSGASLKKISDDVNAYIKSRMHPSILPPPIVRPFEKILNPNLENTPSNLTSIDDLTRTAKNTASSGIDQDTVHSNRKLMAKAFQIAGVKPESGVLALLREFGKRKDENIDYENAYVALRNEFATRMHAVINKLAKDQNTDSKEKQDLRTQRAALEKSLQGIGTQFKAELKESRLALNSMWPTVVSNEILERSAITTYLDLLHDKAYSIWRVGSRLLSMYADLATKPSADFTGLPLTDKGFRVAFCTSPTYYSPENPSHADSLRLEGKHTLSERYEKLVKEDLILRVQRTRNFTSSGFKREELDDEVNDAVAFDAPNFVKKKRTTLDMVVDDLTLSFHAGHPGAGHSKHTMLASLRYENGFDAVPAVTTIEPLKNDIEQGLQSLREGGIMGSPQSDLDWIVDYFKTTNPALIRNMINTVVLQKTDSNIAAALKSQFAVDGVPDSGIERGVELSYAPVIDLLDAANAHGTHVGVFRKNLSEDYSLVAQRTKGFALGFGSVYDQLLSFSLEHNNPFADDATGPSKLVDVYWSMGDYYAQQNIPHSGIRLFYSGNRMGDPLVMYSDGTSEQLMLGEYAREAKRNGVPLKMNSEKVNELREKMGLLDVLTYDIKQVLDMAIQKYHPAVAEAITTNSKMSYVSTTNGDEPVFEFDELETIEQSGLSNIESFVDRDLGDGASIGLTQVYNSGDIAKAQSSYIPSTTLLPPPTKVKK